MGLQVDFGWGGGGRDSVVIGKRTQTGDVSMGGYNREDWGCVREWGKLSVVENLEEDG